MEARIIDLQGQKISISESKGTGTPVILIHGNSLSKETFSKQFDSSLGDKYRLIAFDLPGHGESGKPQTPSEGYSLIGLSDIIVQVIEKLGIENPILVGHSLGGNLANYVASKMEGVKAIVVMGASPLGLPPEMDKAFLPNPIIELAFKGELSDGEGEQLARNAVNGERSFIGDIKAGILNTDPEFRDNIAISIGAGKLMDEFKFIKSFDKLYAIWHAEKDTLINLEYLKVIEVPRLWKDEVIILENAGHMAQMEVPDEFNKMLSDFIESL